MQERVIVLVKDKRGVFRKKIIDKTLEDFIIEKLKYKTPENKLNYEKKYDNLILKYSEFEVYKNYFEKIKQNNQYVFIMKQAIVHHMLKIGEHEPLINSSVIAHILNLAPSSIRCIIRYEKDKHPDYIEVVTIMDKMIKQELYPISKSKNSITVYEWKILK